MSRNLTMTLLAIVVFCAFFSSNVIAENFEKMTPERIPSDQSVPSSPAPLTGDKGFCLIQSDDDNVAYYFGSFGPGDGWAVYMDPAQCPVQDPYPFKVTDVHFYLYNFEGARWPVEIQVSIRDLMVQGDKCNGPGGLLCSQTFTIPIDSAYGNLTHLDLDPFCCVHAPFFLEITYTGGTDSTYPSLMMTDPAANPTDTCDAWFYYQGSYYEWSDAWSPPPPGYPVMRITGHTESMECDPCWYWKPDSLPHAPSGMPDFGQYQFGPPDSTGLCGPTAVANCLWWFDAVPRGIEDPADFIRLLSDYFKTNPATGTYVDSIQIGLDSLFEDYGFELYEHTYFMPEFGEMEDSLERSQDIILLIGFWQWEGEWFRFGGHFVTMSGVCSESAWVAFSDPARDCAEFGSPGRVRPVQHPQHTPGDALHNDPKYVSHDIYQAVLQSESPGGLWWLPEYYLFLEVVDFEGQNFQPGQEGFFHPYIPAEPVFAEIEYAIMICPKPTAVEDGDESSIAPKAFQLYQSHPNPFNRQTIIKYNLLKSCDVTLTIYNVLGHKVKTLVKGHQGAGSRTVNWDGRDEKGREVASGIYFYQLRADQVTQTRRMILLK